MSLSPYTLMQRAVDIVHDSPHPENKVAATLAGLDRQENAFAVTGTNYWPPLIAERIGTDAKIGNASGTVHAEMGCILKAPQTRNAQAFVTDPPCPNCTKYMAEAGVKEIYIDHKGFEKDFAARRGDAFESMSLQICRQAGIKVFEIFRKREECRPIVEIPNEYSPPLENPAIWVPLEESVPSAVEKKGAMISREMMAPILEYMTAKAFYKQDEPFAFCMTRSGQDEFGVLIANVHPVIGYTADSPEVPEHKYSFLMQPVNRLLTNAARKGLEIMPGSIYSSRVPTSRELVNMVGAGAREITIGNLEESRDSWGPEALKVLVEENILSAKE